VQRERDEFVVIDVRQLAFGLRPDELIGIELRRVARKAVRLHPGMAAEKSLDVATPMNFPAIPQQDDRAAKMTEQLAQKRDDLSARDVAHTEIEVQAETMAPRRHGERRDDGDLVASVAVPKERGVPDRRPGLADVGDEEEAAFIDERQMSAAARGVFLSGAIRSVSTGRSPSRRARARAVPASASSTRGRDATAPTRRPGCSGRQTVCG